MKSECPVVLITGGSRGLGRGIAAQLATEGYSLVLGYRNREDAVQKTIRLCEAGRTNSDQAFFTTRGDIGRPDERKHLLQESLAAAGRVDALVNNAGMAPRQREDILDATEESFSEVLQTNLTGPYFLTQQVARYWLKGGVSPLLPGGFKIIFVTSISAVTASVNRGEYCVSKAGLSMARMLWAVRLAEENVSVVEIRPGLMATDMTAGVKDRYDALIRDGLVPQQRWGTPEDVGKAVAAVLRGDFSYSTGTVIDVDGGFHLSRF